MARCQSYWIKERQSIHNYLTQQARSIPDISSHFHGKSIWMLHTVIRGKVKISGCNLNMV